MYSDSFKWDYLQGLFEVVIYGGRISNLYDLRVLSTYLKQYFNSSVIEGNFEVVSGISVPNSANIKVINLQLYNLYFLHSLVYNFKNIISLD